MTTSTPVATVRMPAAVFAMLGVPGAVLGFAAGFTVAPIVRWMLATIDSAPGSMRLLASLPTPWTVAATTVIGLGIGLYLAHTGRTEGLTVTVEPGRVRLVEKEDAQVVARAAVTAVYRDGKDLVVSGAGETELARAKASDLPADELRAAFEGQGYPWRSQP